MTKYKKGDIIWIKTVFEEYDANEKLLKVYLDKDENERIYVSEKNITNPVEIPEELAYWIEKVKCTYNLDSVADVFDFIEHDLEKGILSKSIDEWYNFEDESTGTCHNQNKLAIAWIYGYKVKGEKRYWVKNKDGSSILHRDTNGKVINPLNKNITSYTFTEKEIRDFDERFMAFAIPVEETND